jgi:ERCC4-type nuclease
MKKPIAEPQIVVDTREQQPYPFAGAVCKALVTADYSIVGLEDRIGIERKSLSDLLGCIGGSRDRFERELERLARVDFKALVVEANLNDVLAPASSQLHPNFILGSLVAWSWKYNLPVWLAGNRELAQAWSNAY